MKVLQIAAEIGGSKFYRMDAPADAVAEKYPDIEIETRFNIEVEATRDAKSGFTTVSEVKEDVDLIVVQRPLSQAMNSMILQARRQGIAVAVEIDDDFENIHPKNRAYENVEWSNDITENRQWLWKSCQDTDRLIVSTPQLGRVYRLEDENYDVVPNFVPERYLDIETTQVGGSTLGWSGTLQTHPTDLQTVGDGIARAMRRITTGFHTVGDGNGVGTALSLDYDMSITASGWVALDEYPIEIKKRIGVGVVPLDSIAFNESKSWLKGLEFAALGIPFVASPTPAYKSLAQLGIGELAHSPNEWRKKVEKLAKDGRRRTSLGQRYRDRVRSSLTYELNAHRWVEAWERTIDQRSTP